MTVGFRRTTITVLGLIVILIALTTCGVQTERVHGMIVKVQSAGILDIELLELVDDHGRTWVLVGPGPFGHFTPSHLKQHMVLGEKIEATFYRQDGRLFIDKLADYP